MFLIMSYTHNKVVSALNVNETYLESHLRAGVLWKPGVHIREERCALTPSQGCCASHQPSLTATLKAVISHMVKSGHCTRAFQPQALGSPKGRPCYMALSDQHRFQQITRLLLPPWSPTASPISARGYYPSLLQLHTLEAFYF